MIQGVYFANNDCVYNTQIALSDRCMIVSSRGLSGGAIAGIVVGCVGLIVALVVLCKLEALWSARRKWAADAVGVYTVGVQETGSSLTGIPV
jgi:hypothetical protein